MEATITVNPQLKGIFRDDFALFLKIHSLPTLLIARFHLFPSVLLLPIIQSSNTLRNPYRRHGSSQWFYLPSIEIYFGILTIWPDKAF